MKIWALAFGLLVYASSAAFACSPNRNEFIPASYSVGDLFSAYALNTEVIQVMRVERKRDGFRVRGHQAAQFELVTVETLAAAAGVRAPSIARLGAWDLLRSSSSSSREDTYLDLAGGDANFLGPAVSEVFPTSFCYFDAPLTLAVGDLVLVFRTRSGEFYRREDGALVVPVLVRTVEGNDEFRSARSVTLVRNLDDPNLQRMRSAIEIACRRGVRQC